MGQPPPSVSRRLREKLGDVASLMHGNFLVITLCTSFVLPWTRIFSPYEPVYVILLGASAFIIGAFFAATHLIRVVTVIPGGYLCDIYGRRRIVVIGNSLTAAIRFLVALSTRWELYLAARLILAMSSFWNIAESTLLVDSMEVRKRGLSFSIYWAITQLAGLFSPYIGGLILEVQDVEGLRMILFLIATADAVKALLYARFLEETLKPVKTDRRSLNLDSLLTPFTETLKTLKTLSKPLVGFCILSVVNGFAWMMIMPFVVLYALDVISLSPAEWGLISTIETAVVLLFRIPGGVLADRFSKRTMLLLASICDLAYFIVFIYSRSFLQLLLATIARRVIVTLTDPAWPALQADLIPKRQRGRVFSLLNVLEAPFGFAGSIIGGYLFDLDPALPFWLFIPFQAVGFLTLYWFIREPQEPEE